MRKVDHDSRRRDVAKAAAQLIAERGLEALTTRALARALGCSIGVLSHYFNSKDEIINAAFEWADSDIDTRMQAALDLESPSVDDFIPLLQSGLPLDTQSELSWRVRFNLYTCAYSASDLRDRVWQKFDASSEAMRGLIEIWQQQGQVRNDISAERITSIVMDLIVGAAQNLLRTPMQERRAKAQYLFDLVDTLRVGPGVAAQPGAQARGKVSAI